MMRRYGPANAREAHVGIRSKLTPTQIKNRFGDIIGAAAQGISFFMHEHLNLTVEERLKATAVLKNHIGGHLGYLNSFRKRSINSY
jgi:hypothetical protein